MPNININVADLVCENPIFTSVTYTGTRYEFNLNWTSNGSYYSTFDPTVAMYLYIEMYHPGSSTPYYTGNASIPFDLYDATNYLINVLDYDSSFSSKDRLVFRLSLAGEDSCFTETTYVFPPDTIN